VSPSSANGVEDPRHAEKLHARNRETPATARPTTGAGRRENTMSGETLTYGPGESYRGIVCAEQHVDRIKLEGMMKPGAAAKVEIHQATPTV
jgi:hypothetical protein